MKKTRRKNSLSFLLVSSSLFFFHSLHVRPPHLGALQPPHRLPQALVYRAHGVDDRDGLSVFGPIGLGAVFARQHAPEGSGHAEVDAGADVEVEDVARVGVGLLVFLFLGREKKRKREREREKRKKESEFVFWFPDSLSLSSLLKKKKKKKEKTLLTTKTTVSSSTPQYSLIARPGVSG